MSSILCHRLEIVHVNDVEKISDNQIFLKPDKQLLSVNLENNAIYNREKANNNPGSVYTETVTATTKERNDFPFSDFSLRYYILRLYTDKKSFIVGSIEYPAILTFTNNKMLVNLSFKATSPIK